jgi:murein DD-endopeptidase MepM/ murein hydrolase activator NlpD
MIGTQTIGAGLAVIGAMLLAGGPPAGVPSALSAPPDGTAEIVKIAPASPVQGDTIVVVVTPGASSTGNVPVTVRFDGVDERVYALADGARRAWIGTDPNVAPGAHAVSVTVAGQPPVKVSRTVQIKPGGFGVRRLTLPPSTLSLITAENAAIERRALGPALGRRTSRAMWAGAFLLPSIGVMDSPYGLESVYNGHRMWWHQGVDFAADAGSPVRAANTGIVALAQALPLGGNTVIIDHGQGVLTEYLHLSTMMVRPGAYVDRGALIAYIGATGLVTGPSLHWGLYVNGNWVNPLFWTEPRADLTP